LPHCLFAANERFKVEFLVVAVLITINGFFALSELAFVTSSKAKLRELAAKGSKNARSALKLADNLEDFLSAIQVGITLIGILTGMFGGEGIARIFQAQLESFAVDPKLAHDIALSVTIAVITYLSIVFGELIPKTFAINNPERVAVLVAPVMRVVFFLFYPFVKLLSFSTNFFNRVAGIKETKSHVSRVELKHYLQEAAESGSISEEQNEIHEKLLSFSDKSVRHIMTHRSDVEWIDVNEPNELMTELLGLKHSRILLCDSSLDRVIGVFQVSEVLKKMHREGTGFDIRSCCVSPVTASSGFKVQKLLEVFKESKSKFCIIVDEYGCLSGIVTLHDIVESVIGEIPEEFESSAVVMENEDGSVVLDADARLERLHDYFEIEIPYAQISYSTLSGLVFDTLHTFPKLGEQFAAYGLDFEIVEIDENSRPTKLKISRKDLEEAGHIEA
jgi:putative hemolysin